MGIYEELQELTALKVCKMERLLKEASPTDLDDIQKALANPTISTNALHAVLKKHSYSIGYSALQRHRTGVCGCVNL
jgi:hypothetical protein